MTQIKKIRITAKHSSENVEIYFGDRYIGNVTLFESMGQIMLYAPSGSVKNVRKSLDDGQTLAWRATD